MMSKLSITLMRGNLRIYSSVLIAHRQKEHGELPYGAEGGLDNEKRDGLVLIRIERRRPKPMNYARV